MWRGEAVTFELIGTLYRDTCKFDLYKTHLGQYTNTTLYQGTVKLQPKLYFMGAYRSGKLVLFRVGALDSGMYVYVYVCVCIHVCVHVFVCVYVYMYMYVSFV